MPLNVSQYCWISNFGGRAFAGSPSPQHSKGGTQIPWPNRSQPQPWSSNVGGKTRPTFPKFVRTTFRSLWSALAIFRRCALTFHCGDTPRFNALLVFRGFRLAFCSGNIAAWMPNVNEGRVASLVCVSVFMGQRVSTLPSALFFQFCIFQQ